MINISDIIRSKELGDGFFIFQNDDGYFLGVHSTDDVAILQSIDKETYNSLEQREGNKAAI